MECNGCCLHTTRTTMNRFVGRVRRHMLRDLQHVADKPGLLALRQVVFTLAFYYRGTEAWPINSVRLACHV